MKNRIILGLAMLLLISCQKEKTVQENYALSIQEDVLTEEAVDAALNKLVLVKYKDLDSNYLNYSNPERKFKTELKNLNFYKVFGNQIDLKIVGRFSIRDFIAHDAYYKEFTKNPYPEFEQYWLVDPGVLKMMLALVLELKAAGYDEYGFHIRTAHRHPTKNAKVNGASYSQHLFGRAIDIGVDDINKDGTADQADKMIVYELLQKIVGNKGGLGLYPGSMNLHFDNRGSRARWDYP